MPTPGAAPEQPTSRNRHRPLLLAGRAIAIVTLGYPQIRSEQQRIATIIGEVDSPQTYADLQLLVLSCRRKVEVQLNVEYPHSPPGTAHIFVFPDPVTILPGD